MNGDSATLHALIAMETQQPVPDAVTACIAHLCEHFGETTAGILFYGGGLRQTVTPRTILDFYVVVDSTRAALKSPIAAFAATLLPPNVYMMEIPTVYGSLRAKVAVMNRRGFIAGMNAFASHLWARFAQPAVIVYARDAHAREDLAAALAAAVTTFIARTLPLMEAAFTTHELWVRGLQECYAAELRPEHGARADVLLADMGERTVAATIALLGQPNADGRYPSVHASRAAKAAWWLRRRWGKAANLLRLMNAAFTFKGGLDYAVAKIARHTGVQVQISDRDRRHPLLAGIRVFLEARRRGGVR